ncbi:MAG: hypothetical protein JXA43_01835 [Candidatus Diapherotrites archaeon]|nr:hypothetical protein [Candidatus Diapherotrites archaeon]
MSILDKIRGGPSPAEEEQKIWVEINKLKNVKKKEEQHLTNLVAEYASGGMSTEEYNSAKKDIEAKMGRTEAEIARLMQKISREKIEKGASLEEMTPTLEAANMRAAVQEKENEIKKLREEIQGYKQYVARVEQQGGVVADSTTKLELEVSKVILHRYAEYINKQEAKSISEIKAMVNPEDLTVLSLVKKFTTELKGYSYPSGYERAARVAFEYVRDEITALPKSSGIAYWLYPEDVIKVKAGDNEDQAILLCSILRALGDEDAHVAVVQIDDGTMHSFVMAKINGKTTILDPSQKHAFDKFQGSEQDAIIKYRLGESRISKVVYKFNDKYYTEVASSK